MNPNIRFHLALRVNYPNKFDTGIARWDGRDLKNLGGDIMIHGRENAVGYIPVARKLLKKYLF